MLQNVNLYAFHFEFLASVFPDQFPDLTMAEYLNLVNRRSTRNYYAGTVTRYFESGQGMVYGFTVYTDGADPAELLEPAEVLSVYSKLSEVFALQPLAYAPVRPSEILKASDWISPGFPILFSDSHELPDIVCYSPATNYGRVRCMTLEEMYTAERDGTIGWQDILVLDNASAETEVVVAGVVTGALQGELSHLAVRLARRGVKVLHIQEGMVGETPRRAALLDENFQVLRELAIDSYSKTQTQSPLAGVFRRGDANGDMAVNIADAILILTWLFVEGNPPWCADAADVNDLMFSESVISRPRGGSLKRNLDDYCITLAVFICNALNGPQVFKVIAINCTAAVIAP